ncbi:MAG: DinB family protein [candidate division Zixibacteria bacterium]|nr:DinB family protein [candidate division Zixibacteria bacterium]
MKNCISNEIFVNELLDLLAETFEKTQGIYLDRGNSLFDTLSKISAVDASRQTTFVKTTIAGQVEHIRYYFDVLSSDIQNREIGKVDWNRSWAVQEVTTQEWENLRNQLKLDYKEFCSDIKGINRWDGEDDIGASFAILSHTAYHLGAIRQMIQLIE